MNSYKFLFPRKALGKNVLMKNRGKTLIIIAGPTASGKTAVAAALARKINGEIVSADSRQVYRHLDIGTNKTGVWNPETRTRVTEGIPQHLTDIIDPSETFSAGTFVREAREIIQKIREKGAVPILTGGTGLYFTALIDGLAEMPESVPAVRAELNEELSSKGIEHLYCRLKDVDPAAAEKNRQNPQRLIRALEIYILSGTPPTELQKSTHPSPDATYWFGLDWPREELYAAIDRRSAAMLDRGMIEETRAALNLGFSAESPGLQGIGYRDIVQYLKGGTDRETLREKLSLDTRHYAKRQLTWFRGEKRVRWFPVTAASWSAERIGDEIGIHLGNVI